MDAFRPVVRDVWARRGFCSAVRTRSSALPRVFSPCKAGQLVLIVRPSSHTDSFHQHFLTTLSPAKPFFRSPSVCRSPGPHPRGGARCPPGSSWHPLTLPQALVEINVTEWSLFPQSRVFPLLLLGRTGLDVTSAFLSSRQIMDGSFIQHSVRVLQELNKQREKGQYCDATLDVGGLVFKAHWSVLACCSHFFQSLYGDGSGGSVVLPAGFAEIFGLLLDFFYTGHLALTSGNRDQVLLAARELRVPEAVELCQSFKPKTPVGQAPSGQSGLGKPVSLSVNSHLKEPAGLEEEEVSKMLGQVPRDQEISGSHSPDRPQLGLPAQSESPSFHRGKLKQALKLCPPEDKEPEDCKVPPRPFEAEGVQLQGGNNEVLCPGCWEWGGGSQGIEIDTFLG